MTCRAAVQRSKPHTSCDRSLPEAERARLAAARKEARGSVLAGWAMMADAQWFAGLLGRFRVAIDEEGSFTLTMTAGTHGPCDRHPAPVATFASAVTGRLFHKWRRIALAIEPAQARVSSDGRDLRMDDPMSVRLTRLVFAAYSYLASRDPFADERSRASFECALVDRLALLRIADDDDDDALASVAHAVKLAWETANDQAFISKHAIAFP